MGGMGRNRQSDTSKAAVIGPYPDDGARRMPSASSANVLEAARNKRLQLSASSGRTSTRLAGQAGTRSYVNTFLGGSQ